jgi:hypothetical protein
MSGCCTLPSFSDLCLLTHADVKKNVEILCDGIQFQLKMHWVALLIEFTVNSIKYPGKFHA